jgi:UDP-N-acetylmuramyl pentapeptide phosphotransferase/UDP-N-acetylglucosamine-1-phosphate transferase
MNDLILIFFLIGFGLLFYKCFLLIMKKYNSKLLIDNQLRKLQAFHVSPTPVIGGIGMFFSLIIVFFYFYLFRDIFFFEYLSFCSLFFFLGFVDDIKINFNPKARLILMIVLLALLVKYNNFYLEYTGISFLNSWIRNSDFFSLIFMCLCLLFVVNGANLIDGYNGLLGIHSLIILVNLFFVNYLNENNDLALFLFLGILTLINFLIFNFPKAKIFLGDGGAYLLGVFIAISVIKTSIAIPTISSFYFCILLFYLFFEVFYSFLRKLIVEKASPLYPDKKHLHMLLYNILLKKNKNKAKSNYYVSVIINLFYFILTIPAIFMMNNGMFCKFYSIIFFLIYFFSYKIAYEKVK